LRHYVALICGLAIPFDRLAVIFCHASASSVTHTKIVLRISKALISGFAKPFHRLGFILCHSPALGVHPAKIVLRLDIPLLGCLEGIGKGRRCRCTRKSQKQE
jgi:hypothetical protein